MQLQNNVAVVTGGASGIGRATAELFAKEGARVVIADLNGKQAEEVASAIDQAGGEAMAVQADVTSPEAVAYVFARANEVFGPVTILVNNAGVGLYGKFREQRWEDQQRLLQLNVVAVTELTRRFTEHMLAHGEPSYVLNVSSTAAFQATPGFAVYGPSKSYVRDFSEALAFELRKTNVQVSCLCPGATVTEFSDVAGQVLNDRAHKFMLSAEQVAKVGVKAMRKGRVNVVSGGLNKTNAFMTRLFPRRVTAWAADFAMRKVVSERGEGEAPSPPD
ncbi:MAG: SDR family NAD(P)-dependent oxidoreductase, partial [Thermomicrobiales bacterium]|nr:SDR family NAD(P)-dependent oxidoreductase [Thermomicrobiales bacterium]